MVVRFVPVDDSAEPRSDREEKDLAEVIDFRSKLSAQHQYIAGAPAPAADAQAEMPAAAPLRVLHAVPHESAQGWHDETKNALQADTEGTPRLTRLSRVADFSHPAAPPESVPPTRNDEQLTVQPTRSAYEDAVRVLARRALSRGELEYELLRLGHSQLDSEIVLDEFIERLYLDDFSLARTLTEKLRERKGASRSHIKQKLRERKITDDVVALALAELDEEEEFDLLREAAFDRARKLGGLDRATAERRLLGFLARRGWSGEQVHRAVREALDGESPKSRVNFE